MNRAIGCSVWFLIDWLSSAERSEPRAAAQQCLAWPLLPYGSVARSLAVTSG